ncbi:MULTISPECIES: flavin-containing monooxygenase [Streptomyces]|uniref:flavin-containing monooxygenase n=1 Tax=Streptomyces TaxID=1883 RepID=UPI002E30668F|nr:NAD(P)/FAD-dependent oxidoreductase [Streptomyces canus]WSZ34880.1 NAD(P)/FAD-dependent oxidoreductase [Streptomyces sp. NBC_00882]
MGEASNNAAATPGVSRVDALVVGAGLGGLYAMRRLREDGLSVIGLEGAEDVGGVWLHNRYPGARVDIEAYYYCYFDPELYPEWKWSDRYPAQAEILSYLRHYSDRYELRPHFRFNTWAEQMRWLPEQQRWRVQTSTGDVVEARHVLLATGQLSKSRELPFPGIEDFTGEWVETSHWPKRPVQIAGRRVAVIGTGSSGVQTITEVAKEAASLHVFQRTPNYVVPSQNAPIDREKYADHGARITQVWDEVMKTGAAYLAPVGTTPATELTPEEQQDRLKTNWDFGGLSMTFVFPDQRTSWETNALVSNFVRGKIREAIDDPELADVLEPKDYPIGTRRLAVCNGYYETYNRDNVHLVNLRKEPIEAITPTGIRTSEQDYEFDLVISALGFDAFTGPVDAIDIRNERGERPTDSWQRGPSSYLGLMLNGFPNLYFLTGPGSPSVLVNFNVHNVFHVDMVADLAAFMAERGHTSVQPDPGAQAEWRDETQRAAEGLLRKKVDNYMTHVNDDGSRFFVPYAGGWSTYVDVVHNVVAEGYRGFVFANGDGHDPASVAAEPGEARAG